MLMHLTVGRDGAKLVKHSNLSNIAVSCRLGLGQSVMLMIGDRVKIGDNAYGIIHDIWQVDMDDNYLSIDASCAPIDDYISGRTSIIKLDTYRLETILELMI